MELFTSNELTLVKSVKKGDKESLLSLFNAADRFKSSQVLLDAVEDTTVRVSLSSYQRINSSTS